MRCSVTNLSDPRNPSKRAAPVGPFGEALKSKMALGVRPKIPTKAQSSRRLGREVRRQRPCPLYPWKRQSIFDHEQAMADFKARWWRPRSKP